MSPTSDTSTKIHIPQDVRPFGLGFGSDLEDQVIVYTNSGPVTGPLLDRGECQRLADWKGRTDDVRSANEVVKADSLATALHNYLLHMDMLERVKLLPTLLKHMEPEERALLLGNPNIDKEVWQKIDKARPYLAKEGFDVANPQAYFAKLGEKGADIQIKHHTIRKKAKQQDGSEVEFDQPHDDITFNGVSLEAAATVIASAFNALEKSAKAKATEAIARALKSAGKDKDFFGPLSDPNRNRLIAENHKSGHCATIENNGRVIKILSKEGETLAFQGESFTSNDLHFHPLKNADPSAPIFNKDGNVEDKHEFLSYRDAAHRAQCEENPDLDPNRNVVGQLHLIYISPGKHAMLLGANVTLGEPNDELGKYIAFTKKKIAERNEAIGEGKALTQSLAIGESIDAKDLRFDPMNCFDYGFYNRQDLPLSPFTSLHLGALKVDSLEDIGVQPGRSEIFYRGVRAIDLGKSITISKEQLADLRMLQPEMKAIDDETAVHPIQADQQSREILVKKSTTNRAVSA